MKQLFVVAFSTLLLVSCTSESIRKEVTKQSDLHGLGYPFTFERAKELQESERFEAASYVYINLYQHYKDSVIKEVIRMHSDIVGKDSSKSVLRYLQQAVSSEGKQDADAYDREKEQKKKRMDTLFFLTSDLLDNLYPYGIK